MTQSSKAPDRDLLLEHHRFPGPYTIKAFGPGQASFRGDVDAALLECGLESRAQLSERNSKGGNRMCVTIVLQAQTVDEVIALYEALHRMDSLRLIL